MSSPLKRSLASVTRKAILAAIQSGEWSGHLPGERRLCDHYQVSRPTLRQALKRLEQDGVVSNQQGQRRKILIPASVDHEAKEKPVIGFLCPNPTKEMFGHTSRKIAAIEYHIHQRDIGFELLVRPGCYTKTPAKALRALIEETQIKYWILQETNFQAQLWFQENGIPAVITGSRFDGIEIPFVDLDNAAVCRHAVGLFLAKKRRSLCYLTISDPLPGDLKSETGFTEGIKQGNGVHGKVARTKGTPEGICGKLDIILESSQPPDALLIDKTSHAFCVASYLLSKGYRIPNDIAIICRTESHDLQYMRPSIAHYSTSTEELAKKTAEQAIRLVNGDKIDLQGVSIIPEFVPGQSL